MNKKYEIAPNMFWSFESKRGSYNNREIKLTRNETSFLELLISSPNKLFSDTEIISYVWSETNVTSTYVIRNLVKNLRKKLSYDIIENSYGLGYKLISFKNLVKKKIDFLENIKDISQIMQQTQNSKELIKKVLEKTLKIFDCDRVFLLYPLDIEVKSFRIPYEVTKNRYAGACALNIDIEMTNKQYLFFKSVLEAQKPYYFNKSFLSDVKSYSENLANSDFIPPQSGLVYKIKPQIDNYWGFGMHQCSYERVWNEDEIELFKEIGLRLSDALTILLLYEQTKLSRDSYQNINSDILKELSNKNQQLTKINLELQNKICEIKELQTLFIKNAKTDIINELLINIANQWKQPLTIISMGSMGIKLRLKAIGISDENINQTVSLIETETKYLSEIINKFSNFFKADREKQEFYISKIVFDTLDLLRNSLVQNNINLSIEIDEDFKIYNYLNELQQVIYYILVNAKEALLKIDKIDKEIKIILIKYKNNILIKICDNGSGIDKYIQDKVYEPYFTTKFSKKGIGLSLYICKILIEHYLNGELLIESSKNKTEFIIMLKNENSKI